MKPQHRKSDKSSKRGAAGFTLLEMVIAIGIFAIIAAISYASLNRFIATRDTVNQRQDYLQALQTTMTLLGRDVRFMMDRSVRDGFGDPEPALMTGEDVRLGEGEFFRVTTGLPESGSVQLSAPQRVGWRLIDGELQRVIWQVVDRDQDSESLSRTVLENVGAVSIRYVTYTDEGEMESIAQWTEAESLPAGVEFILTLENGQEYSRLFAIAGSS